MAEPDGPDCPACERPTNVDWGWHNEPIQSCPHCGIEFRVHYEDDHFDGESTWPCWILTPLVKP